jgi:hypothetical protein
MEHLVEAQVIDSRHLKLKRPIKIAPGSTVMITIEPAEGVAEDQEWYLLSSQPLMARTSLIIPWIGSRHPTRNISHERGGYHPYADAASGWQG